MLFRTLSWLGARRLAALAAGLLLASLPSIPVRAFEAPPSSDPAAVLGDQARGENYRVASVVRSDGFLQIFTVESKYGTFTVGGRELLNRRLRELAALHALERMNQSEQFAKSLAQSATSPLRFGRDLLLNPFATVEQTVTGVGDAFGKVAAGVDNMGGHPDNLTAGVLGVSAAKRHLAAELGVDPYTDFKPLADKLDEVATTIAIGGLAPRVAFSAIGGGAGMIVSSAGSAESVRTLVRDKTAAQLIEANRAWLREMGVDARTVHAFLDNDYYTLTDKTRLVSALHRLGGVRNRAIYVKRAATAQYRDLAYFLVRRAEMIADYQRSSGGNVTQFVSANGLPVNVLADGRIVIIAPIDLLAWSETPLQAVAAISAQAHKKGKPIELRISGTATPVAHKELHALRWKLSEGKAY